ncbi:MAG: hypothetical protein HWE26_17205 [Alteromonadaceae bacterium]|nr:hypothetical protein [Alteromonadaceae bacterium]
MPEITISRLEFKNACTAFLDQVALEHAAGHQGKLAGRYTLIADGGTRIGIMFEKSEKTQAHCWVEARFADSIGDIGIEHKRYMASDLYKKNPKTGKISYGRHAALKSMRDLCNADLVRFTPVDAAELERLVNRLKAYEPITVGL